MKVVINNCFGGFVLSLIAQKRFMELEGKEIYFYKKLSDSYVLLEDDELENVEEYYVTTFSENLGKVIDKFPKENYIYLWREFDNRTNPNLVKVVEELGEKANGLGASLKVVEIPDDVEYKIEEYDGCESIEEVHRSWY